MAILIEYALFFSYVGLAVLVGVIAILWGNDSKIAGVGLLVGSIIVSNILYILMTGGVLSFQTLSLIYGVIDLALAYCFLLILQQGNRLERNRWAGWISFIHIIMATTNIIGAAQTGFAESYSYGLTLNLLVIAALVICLFGFTPKSKDEALAVLKMKWIYFKSDLFRFLPTRL